MPRALNTSHPLYANIVSLIGVDDDGVTVKDFADASRVCTVDAAAAIGSGTYGYHVRTSHSGNRSLGIRLSKLVPFGNATVTDATLFIVTNASNWMSSQYGNTAAGGFSTASFRQLVGADTAVQAYNTACPRIAVSNPATTPVVLNGRDNAGTVVVTGTTSLSGKTNVSIAVTRTGLTAHEVFVDGVLEGSGGSLGSYATGTGYSSIGGYVGWDYGYAQSDFVWVVAFDRKLTATEIADLHATLGADNAFGLVTAGTGNSITVDEFDRYKVIPTGPSGASVTFTGTYSGADPASVQIRILEFGSVTEVSTWQTLDATPASGTFSGTITVPRGGWYEAEVRYSDDTPTAASTSLEFGVGVVAFALGQSHLDGFLTEGASPAASSSRIVTHNGTAYALVPSAGSGQHQMLNDIEAALDCPICWIPKGVGGTLLSYWYSSGGGPTAAMNTELAKLTAAGGSAHIFVWWQGDANAQGATPKATYRAELDSLAAYMRANYGVDAVVVCALGRYGSGGDAVWNNIREAHVGFCEASADNYIVVTTDLAQEVDQQHFTEAGEIVAGQRLADVIAEAMGAGSGSQGPRVSSAVQSGADTVDVTITHDGGADISPATGITGFSAYLSGAPLTISSVARLTANSVRITLAAPSSVDSIRYQYGAYPDVSGKLVDDTSLALPLRSTPDAVLTGVAVIQPSGIASAEAFGTATIARTSVAPVTLTGIASGEAFGTATVSATAPASVTLTGIPSAEAFGDPTVARSSVASVTLSGIPSAEAFGTASVSSDTTKAVTLTGISSGEAFGAATVARSSLSQITLAGIVSAEAFGAATVTRAGSAAITLTGIASGEAFGAMVVGSDLVAVLAAARTGTRNIQTTRRPRFTR